MNAVVKDHRTLEADPAKIYYYIGTFLDCSHKFIAYIKRNFGGVEILPKMSKKEKIE